jgi:hypothetical protein
MATRNTGTSLVDSQQNNRTATHLTTNIIIKVDGNIVGAVQSLSFSENRAIYMLKEIGTDGNIDSAPQSATQYSGNCTRVRFARTRITEAFGRGFIHVHSQRIPFDIEIQDIFADSDRANAVITILKNVWVENLQTQYQADNYIISEQMSFKFERIYSFINNRNVVQAASSDRQFPIVLNQFEQEADRGAYIGALDAPGLLNAFLNDPRV